MSGEYNPLVGEHKYYSVPSATGATSYYWYFDVGNNQTGTNIDGWQILSGQGTTGALIKVGNPGTTVIVCKATNSCGYKIKYKYVSPRTLSDPCDETLNFSSNPMKSGNANTLIFIEDPCDFPNNNLVTGITNEKDIKTSRTIKDVKTEATLSIFNNFGEQVYSGNQQARQFDVSNLKKGFYIVKYQTAKGNMITKKLIVE
jgi:hypothetical protein